MEIRGLDGSRAKGRSGKGQMGVWRGSGVLFWGKEYPNLSIVLSTFVLNSPSLYILNSPSLSIIAP